MKSSTLVILIISSVAGLAVGADEFRQDFRAAPPDPKMLTMIGLDAGSRAEPGPDGMSFRIPPGAKSSGMVGMVLRPWLEGDFEITASYGLIKVGPPTGGHGAGVGLVIETNSADHQSLTIERLVLPKDGDRFTSTHIFADSWGEKQYRPERAEASSKSGKIRLIRAGSKVEAWYSDGGAFRFLRKVEIGTEDVSLVRLACYTGSSDCEVIATINDLAIRGGAFTSTIERRSGGPSRPGTWKTRLALAGLINLGFVLALAAWRWPGLPSRIAGLFSRDRPGGRTPRDRGTTTAILLGLATVTGLSAFSHHRAIASNYVHEDERIWVACSYYYRLVMRGDFDNPRWGGFDGVDAPHVAHLLIGAGLVAAGQPVPAVPTEDISWAGQSLPSGALLRAARMPGTLLGIALAPMIFLLAYLAAGRWIAGLVAGLLYAVHPLALLCQARAMSDAPLMFFGVGAILCLAWACRRGGDDPPASLFGGRTLLLMIVGPVLLGLAVGSKLTGVFTAAAVVLTLGLVVASGWSRRAGRGWLVEGLAYVGLFVGLTASWSILVNPTLYPGPPGKFKQMLDHRWNTGQGQRAANPEWGVYNTRDRFRAFYDRVVVDGSGRFALPMLILSVLGLGSMAAGEIRRVRRRQPPSPALAVLAWSALLFGVMLPSLPLNWERYYLPFLPILAIGAGAGLATIVHGLASLVGSRVTTVSMPEGEVVS